MANAGAAEFIRCLEGRRVSVALIDGSRLDDCDVVSAGRHGVDSLWLVADGVDRFVALVDVAEVWESPALDAVRPEEDTTEFAVTHGPPD